MSPASAMRAGRSCRTDTTQRLLRDVEAGKVDVVVVYKVDRLSRSLLDFAKLVEIFDRHGVSFISVTQHFNTTDSMGRLTLNILLSFAQFEREIIAERIRDKIAAAKRRGKQCGGRPVLGYDLVDGKLAINPEEAQLVRHIFRRFLRIGSATQLARELNAQGHTTKSWTTKRGKRRAGRPWNKSHLYRMLNNPKYIGEVTHKGQVYPGEHEAIIDRELWDKVHSILAKNHRGRAAGTRARTPAMLKGLIRCGHCDTSMGVTFTRKNGRMYRYYLCLHASKNGHDACPVKSVAAGEIEKAVVRQLRAVFRTPGVVAQTLRSARRHEADEIERLRRRKQEIEDRLDALRRMGSDSSAAEADDARRRLEAVTSQLCAMEAHSLTQEDVIDALRNLEPVWDELFPAEQARIVELLVREIVVRPEGLDLYFRTNGLRSLVAELGEREGHAPSQASRIYPAVGDGDSLLIHVPMRFKRRGGRKEIFVPDMAQDGDMPATPAQEPLVNALGLAYRWQRMLDSGEAATAGEIAEKAGMSKAYVTRMLRLNTLAPDIVEAILDGREPSGLSLGKLSRPLPLLWKDQRNKLGFGAPEGAVAATA